MKTTKRFLTLALVLMMVLSMAAPAMAAEGDFTITITNSDTDSSAGHVYKAYQIFDGVLDSTGTILTEIEWGQNITNGDAFIAALKAETAFGADTANIFYNADSAAAVAAIMAKAENQTTAKLEAFGKVATAQISGEPVAQSAETDAPYTITIPAEKAGYYLIKDGLAEGVSNVNKDISDYILQVIGSVTVEHKGSIPTVIKTVSENNYNYYESITTGINRTHYYSIQAELPDDYRLYDKYYLEFSDKLSKGLTYDDIVEVMAVIRSSGTQVLIHPSSYTVNTTPIAEDAEKMPGGTHLQVVFEDTKVAVTDVDGNLTTINLTAEDAIEVIYKAHVNSDAVVDGKGIPNEVTIVYSNDPNSNGKGESTPDETNVYPINLQVVKVDGKDNTVKLAGAKFVLSHTYSDGTTSTTEYAVVDATTKKLSGWAKHYEGDGCETHEEDELMGSILVTDAEGNLGVIGLKPGKYDLIEIAAPDGYNMLTENVVISVDITIDEENDVIKTMTGNVNQGNIAFTPENATVTITIPNFKGDVLPSTGGMGTTLFYLVGGLMVAAALILLVTKKRMSAEA